jgi:hypothetical protein
MGKGRGRYFQSYIPAVTVAIFIAKVFVKTATYPGRFCCFCLKWNLLRRMARKYGLGKI